MKTIGVKVQPDYLERIATAKSPFPAVSELVWNALDADANTVRVILAPNALTGLEKIIVEDDGHGIAFEDAEQFFSQLGGSWKRQANRSNGGRILHGKGGQGRFRAFGLGEYVEWQTVYASEGKFWQYTISGSRSNLGEFKLSDPHPTKQSITGTRVTVTNLAQGQSVLQTDEAAHHLTETLALYLLQYPNVRIFFDSRALEAQAFIKRKHDEYLTPIMMDGAREPIEARLTIIEWPTHQSRALILCDDTGFALEEMTAGIQAPGFRFTAYLCSNFLRDLANSGMLDLSEMNPGMRQLLGEAKTRMREYFRQRAAENARGLMDAWKEANIYPYSSEPVSVLELAERQMFDVMAFNLNAYLPDFGGSGDKGKRLSLRLLRQALEENPAALQRILGEVLDLPAEKQTELAELLERTSLASIINASKLIADRLDFLTFLEALLYDRESKKTLRERTELHRILAENTWIFGEEYFLTVDDQSLKEVLKQHIKLLGRDELIDTPVTLVDGSQGIIDMMLSRRVALNNDSEREHLVIELKRPSVKLDFEVYSQINKYAVAVAGDQRFHETSTRWVFWAISNEVDKNLRLVSEGQTDRADGLVTSTQRFQVWMKTWGQVIDACRARLAMVQRELEYNVTRDDALTRLRSVYEKYLQPSNGKKPAATLAQKLQGAGGQVKTKNKKKKKS